MLLGLIAFCHAQLKITLTFESAAPRDVFVASELPKSPPTTAVKAAGPSLDFNVPAFGGNDRIYVWDHSTNNIASKPIKDIPSAGWAPKAADFNTIGTITVRIEHKGLPVQAAKVSLSTKGKSEEKLLDPSGRGDVTFFGYPVGDLHVKASYNTIDKKEGSQELIFSETLKRERPEIILTVAVSEDVATIAEAPPGAPGAAQGSAPLQGQQKTSGPPPTEGSPVGKLIIIILSLVVIGFLGFWVFFMAKNNPRAFEEKLQKLGVQIPNQQDPNLNAPTPVAPLAPAPPPPKIMLDDAEPVPLGTAAVAVIPATMVATGEPALVSESGERTTLTEGETLVGREDGLGLSLAGESTVSRRHASLTRSGKTAVLKDLGSTNGTFVNGSRLQGETTLKPGDQVQFGSVRFRYEG